MEGLTLEGQFIAMQLLHKKLKIAKEDAIADKAQIKSLQKQLTKALADKHTAIAQARQWQKKCEHLSKDNRMLRSEHEKLGDFMRMDHADPEEVCKADPEEVCNKSQPSQPSHPPPRHLLVGKFMRKSKSKLPTKRSYSKGPVKNATAIQKEIAKVKQAIHNAKKRTRSSSKARALPKLIRLARWMPPPPPPPCRPPPQGGHDFQP